MKNSMDSVGVLGSGDVGRMLAKGFTETGHSVMVGTRDQTKPELVQLKEKGIKLGSFSDTAKFGKLLVIATRWTGTRNMLTLAGEENFDGKLVIDVTNPLDFSKGGAPGPAVAYPDSAGKTVQAWLPKSKVVKAFNVISNHRMFHPQFTQGTPVMLISGNDDSAKDAVKDILHHFGWSDIADMGPIDNAHLQEYLALAWITYGFLNKSWNHGWALLKE
jgi:8-hydroxy-5-deazaflavin:NADPH oxidoreductase